MFGKGFFLFEFEIALNAFDSLAEVDHFGMPIEMMFIAETHAAVVAPEAFDVCMRDHVSFEVRAPLEGFTAVLLSAYVVSGLCVSLMHMAVEVRQFLEEFVADFAGLAVLLELFRQLAESGLLKLL
jgi:hypothetical protein